VTDVVIRGEMEWDGEEIAVSSTRMGLERGGLKSTRWMLPCPASEWSMRPRNRNRNRIDTGPSTGLPEAFC
jgi:hypothetical protein